MNDKNTSTKRVYTRPVRAKKKRTSLPYRLRMIFFILMACIGAVGLIFVSRAVRREQQKLDKLAGYVDDYYSTPGDITGQEEAASSNESGILPQYQQLYRQNQDLFGWISIENTDINYPVMHTPSNPEKYLRRDFDGNYSYSGLPFLDADCTADSDNMLIYGHNMIDDGMFTQLEEYSNRDFWLDHPVIRLDTLYRQYEYQVIYAFYDRVYDSDEDVFKFYHFTDVDSEDDFAYAINSLKSKALYDTGITASYGDRLITLVTCGYHTSNGRFVVVARRK